MGPSVALFQASLKICGLGMIYKAGSASTGALTTLYYSSLEPLWLHRQFWQEVGNNLIPCATVKYTYNK